MSKKSAIIVAVALISSSVVQAQTVKELERAGFVRDSVAEVLAEHRRNFDGSEESRKRLSQTILSLEQEVARLQGEYERIVASLSQRDAKLALERYAKACEEAKSAPKQSTTAPVKEQGYTPDKARMKRDLTANDYFASRLSASDYKILREAQMRETKVGEAVSAYMAEYGNLLALQRSYMEVATKAEADSVATLFAAKCSEMAEKDAEITSMWSSLYYNKIYTYDLLMERSGNTAMLDYSADVTSRAEREVNESSDIYQSNALVGYYARKKALTDYEMQIASVLSLTTSRDSLRLVAAGLKNRDYRLSKLALQRRSFIVYENIEIKKPTIYTPQNPIPHTKVYDYGTIYRVRIGLFANRPNLSALRGVTPLSYTDAYNKGLYAYFVGGFRTEQEAQEGAAYLKKLGFKSPIVAVWVDGEYYPTVDEMRRSESLYNIEISGVATLTDEMKARILAHKSDCAISRIGSSFVVSAFEGKSAAEAVAADLRTMSSEIIVEIAKKP